MLNLIVSIIYLIISVDIILLWKYKVMHDSKHKYALAILHLMILITNVILFYFILIIEYFQVNLIIKFINLLFILIGIFIILLAIFYLKKQIIFSGKKIINNGPFKYSRHPIYASDIVIVINLSILFGSLEGLVYSFILIFVLWYLAKKEEEELEMRLFGYSEYKRKVPIFF